MQVVGGVDRGRRRLGHGARDVLELGHRHAGQPRLGRRHPRRTRVDAAERQPRLPDPGAGVGAAERQRDAQGRTLMDAELHVGGRRAGGPRRQPHRGQQLVRRAGRRPGAADEVAQRQLAAPAPRHQLHACVQREEQRGEIAVGIGEREVAADGADVAHADVGHVAGDRGQQRAVPAHERRALHRPVGDGGPEREAGAVGDGGEAGDALDVDQVTRAEQAELHQQQQLGATGVGHGVLAEPRQEPARLLGRAGTVQGERAEHG